jgi:hypothetical protein
MIGFPKPTRKPKTKARKTFEQALRDAKAREKELRATRTGQKFGNKRTDGFDSQLEAAVYGLLHQRERAGEIRNVQRQVGVELTAAHIRCKLDFGFEYVANGSQGYAEAKGAETDRWRIWLKLFREYGEAPLEIWKGSHQEPRLVEVIRPKREKGK